MKTRWQFCNYFENKKWNQETKKKPNRPYDVVFTVSVQIFENNVTFL